MDFLEKVVANAFGEGSRLIEAKLVGGGCINHAAKIKTSEGIYFVKWGPYDLSMFEAEATGLELLRKHTSVHIPKVFAKGRLGSDSFLLMEWIEAGLISGRFWHNFASGLAELHRNESEFYGFPDNNFIGSLPQINDERKNWLDFFIECRLEPQLKRAADSGKVDDNIMAKFPSLFGKLSQLIPEEPASLLHGDLWSGNFMTGPEGHVAILIRRYIMATERWNFHLRSFSEALTRFFTRYTMKFIPCNRVLKIGWRSIISIPCWYM